MTTKTADKEKAPSDDVYRIVRLTASNVKRLKAVDMTPPEDMVVIAGKNAQGKTSLLDAIMYALAGKRALPTEPMRRGEHKAEVVVDLGDIIVKRVFERTGTRLEVTSKDGAKYASPQAVLDGLVGKLTFDPLMFTRLDDKSRAETLRGVVGLDTGKLDMERERLYNMRRDINRKASSLTAQLEAMPEIDKEAGQLEVSSSEILARIDTAQATNNGIEEEKRACRELESHLAAQKTVETRLAEQVRELGQALDAAGKALGEHRNTIVGTKAKLVGAVTSAEKSERIDLGPLRQELGALEERNRHARENARRSATDAELDTVQKQADMLTNDMAALDKEKAKLLDAVNWPIEGLAIDDRGVTYNDTEWSQCSSAEQLQVSMAIGLAVNPKLRILLIRDGSLLDDESMAAVRELAKDRQAQIWLERVSPDGQATVVIEDGQIAKSEPAE